MNSESSAASILTLSENTLYREERKEGGRERVRGRERESEREGERE